MSVSIHPTAVIADGAKLGENVTVGPCAVIEDEVTVGDGCRIGPHATLLRYTELGPECAVHAGAVLGDLPQDLAFEGVRSFVRIGAGCVIRECVTINRGTKPDTATEVGEGCFLMALSHLAHNVTLGRRVIVANGALLAGYVSVGDGAFISGNCLVHQFVRIGRLAMLGGGSGLGKDLPPFMTLERLRVNRVMGPNVIGMRRAGIGPEARKEIRRAYALLCRSGLSVTAAAAEIGKTCSSDEAREIRAFVEESKRGVCNQGGGGGEVD